LPFYRRLPFKRGEGFSPLNRVTYNEINLDQLDVLPSGSEATPETMLAVGLVRDPRRPIVVLGRGDMKSAMTVRAHRFSKTAKEKIQAAGGTFEELEF
jgi:large subunit ribosomal protein L15